MGNRWECLRRQLFDGDIVITDPCYLGSMDWDELEDWCADHGLISSTFYGDWGCTVYKTESCAGFIKADAEKIGRFCADGGMVCVMHMKDVLEKFPGFAEWVNAHPWCATIIKGFQGKVRLIVKKARCKIDWELRVRGDGKVDGKRFSFESLQTSL